MWPFGGHPSLRALTRVVAGDAGARERRRVYAHLGECTACRSRFLWVRELPKRLEKMAPGETPRGAEGRVLATRRAGGRVLLPASELAPVRRRAGTPVRRASVAALAALTLGWVASQRGLGADSERGSLTAVPNVPAAGASVELVYRAGHGLRHADSVIVRGRTGGPVRYDTPPPAPRRLTVLRRRGDVFHGTFSLGPEDVYAQMVVEDPDGEVVDDNGARHWFVLTGSGGRPGRDALWSAALLAPTWEEQHERIGRGVRLHPDDPRLLASRLALDLQLLTRTQRDSALSTNRETLARIAAGVDTDTLSASRLAGFVEYAGAVGDHTLTAAWTERLVARFPDDPEAVWYRVPRFEGDGEPATTYLERLERLWETAGPHPALTLAGVEMARRAGLPRVWRSWVERELAHPAFASDRVDFLTGLEEAPGASGALLELLRGELRRPRDERALGATISQDRAERDERARALLTAHGRALLRSGRVAAAVDTLRLAVERGWAEETFRSYADALLAAGNREEAARSLARAAAYDPGGGRDDTRGADWVGERRWHTLVAAAERELRGHLLADREPAGDFVGNVRLFDADGRAYALDDLRAGRITVLAAWEPWSGPAVRDIEELGRVGERVGALGGSLIVVTRAEPTAHLRALLGEHGARWVPYHDLDRSLTSALETTRVPEYTVVGHDGRVAFLDVALSAVPALVEALSVSTGMHLVTQPESRDPASEGR